MISRRQKAREKRIRESLSLEICQGFCQGASVTHGLVHGADEFDMNAQLGKIGFAAPILGSRHIRGLVGVG